MRQAFIRPLRLDACPFAGGGRYRSAPGSENEKLRTAYLDSVKESLNFGSRAKDFLNSLPTMTVGAAGGVTLAHLLGISETLMWGIGRVLPAPIPPP